MSNEKLETRSDVLFGKLVPGSGNAGTMEGEMLRAINKIIYSTGYFATIVTLTFFDFCLMISAHISYFLIYLNISILFQ